MTPTDDGGPGCELTRQLAISSATYTGDLAVGASIDIIFSLTNQGPLDHTALPGVELLLDSPYFEAEHIPNDGFYQLQAGQTESLQIPVRIVSLPPPCSQVFFHLRARSYMEEGDCLGESYNLAAVVSLPNRKNCPACPPMPGSGTCSTAGLQCFYPGNISSCWCDQEKWQCNSHLQ